MTKQQLNDVFGIPSWLDFYKILQEKEMLYEEFIDITVPALRPRMDGDPATPVYNFRINDIKAWAFDELYSSISLPDSVLVIQEMLGDIVKKNNEGQVANIYTFLNNLKTRTL